MTRSQPRVLPGPVPNAHLPRRAGSVRRTTSIDMWWPDGERGDLHLVGCARDLVTDVSGAADVAGEGAMRAVVTPARTLRAIETDPPLGELTDLVGASVAGGYRTRLRAAVPDELDAGSAVHLLLDDVVGASIVSDFALRQWQLYANTLDDRGGHRRMLGVCTAFGHGSSALNPDGSSTGLHSTAAVEELAPPDDPVGWHPMPEPAPVSMRRGRRLDCWRSAGEIVVDAMFQDSCTAPEGGRQAVHEYRLRARATGDGRLVELSAVPRTLPYRECPMATANLQRLVGTPLGELRSTVGGRLRGTAGCTHLNDAMRGLSDVPGLLALLDG